MAGTTSSHAARIVARFRNDKGSADSALVLLDDVREVGRDKMLALTTEDRKAEIPDAVKKAAKGKPADSPEVKARNKAIKRAKKTADDWGRQVWTALALYDMLLPSKASADIQRQTATLCVKRARRGKNAIVATGCKHTASGDDLVSAVTEAIKGKNGRPTVKGKEEVLADISKALGRDTTSSSENTEGPLLKASRAKVAQLQAALVAGTSGDLPKAAKVAEQIREALDYLNTQHDYVTGIIDRAERAAAEAAAKADAQEVEDAA